METFIHVVDAASFKKAAKAMRVLPSTITKTIQDLEAHLGAQLLIRTTRTIRVTEAGLRYYDSCHAVIRDVYAAENAVLSDEASFIDTIRVGTTPSLARHFLIPSLPRFTAGHPRLSVDFQLTETVDDLIQEGIDCMIRPGEPESSSLIQRHIADIPWCVCAAPAYLERYGEPTDIVDLSDHVAVGYAGSRTSRSTYWEFVNGRGLEPVSLPDHIIVNDSDAYLCAGVAGLGLIRVPLYMAQQYLNDGRLKQVLLRFKLPVEPLIAFYPQSRYLSPGVKAFTDWSADMLQQEAKKWS